MQSSLHLKERPFAASILLHFHGLLLLVVMHGCTLCLHVFVWLGWLWFINDGSLWFHLVHTSQMHRSAYNEHYSKTDRMYACSYAARSCLTIEFRDGPFPWLYATRPQLPTTLANPRPPERRQPGRGPPRRRPCAPGRAEQPEHGGAGVGNRMRRVKDKHVASRRTASPGSTVLRDGDTRIAYAREVRSWAVNVRRPG